MPTAPQSLMRRYRRWQGYVPVVAAAFLFLVGLGSSRALTDHEALLAGSAKQMVQSGDWLLLKIGDQPWLEKPALPQWLAAVSAQLWGRYDEWSMRFPFAIAGIVVVGLITQLMTSLFGRTIGTLSGLVQATCVYQVAYARLAESDVMLQMFVIGAISVFATTEMRRNELSPGEWSRRRWLFWSLLGATNLAKGLAFGGVLTLVTCGGWLLLRRDVRGCWRWWSPVGMLLALAISAAWPVAVVWRDPSVLQLWSDHTVGRAAGSLGYPQPFWYYATTWVSQLLPWTPFFLIGAPLAWRRAREDANRPECLMWWWLLSHPLLLSLSSGKHHHYLIYALPASSPIIAMGLSQAAVWLRDERRAWWGWTLSLQVVAAAVVVAGSIIAWQEPALLFSAVVMASLLAAGMLALQSGLQRRSVPGATAALFGLVITGHVLAQAVVLPRRDPSAADKRFLAEVETLVAPQQPLVASGCQEIARHMFYVQPPVVGIWHPADIGQILPAELAERPQWFVITRGHAREQLAAYGAVTQVAQSQYTRRESVPEDRYTLFRIDRAPRPLAMTPSPTNRLPATTTLSEVVPTSHQESVNRN